jgi:hypothetical protein
MQKDNENIFDMYKQIVSEGNVALYAYHTGKESRIPDRDEISKNLALLRPLGVADDSYAKRISIDSSFEKDESKDLFSDIVSKKIGIKSTKNKDKVGDLSAFLRRMFVKEGVTNGIEILKKILPNGVFNINAKSSYNARDEAIAGLMDLFSDDKNSLNGLLKIMDILIRETPNLASTNIGPGEIFFALFSNAQLAGAGGGSKSGDLEISLAADDQGGGEKIMFELKATLARFGGDRSIIHGADYIKKIIGDTFKKETPFLDEAIKFLLEMKSKLDSYVGSDTPYKDFYDFYTSQFKKLNKKVYANLSSIDSLIQRNLNAQLPNGMSSSVDATGNPATLKRKTSRTLHEFLSKKIHEKLLSLSAEMQKTKDSISSRNIAENTYSAFKALQLKDDVNEDLILDILLSQNSYAEDNLLKKSGKFDIRGNLRTLLFSKKTPKEVLSMSYDDIEKLLGAMHLVSYANDKQFNKLLMLGTETKNVKIFDSPTTFDLAFNIVNDPDVRIDPIVDRASGATIIGTSAMIYIQ